MRHAALICLLSAALLSGCEPAGVADRADVNQGKKLFKLKCATCHGLGEVAYDKRGPNLAGLMQRQVGTVADYGHYSPALRALSLSWTPDRLEEFLQNPSAFVQHHLGDPAAQSRMNVRIKAPDDRRALVAYLSLQ